MYKLNTTTPALYKSAAYLFTYCSKFNETVHK